MGGTGCSEGWMWPGTSNCQPCSWKSWWPPIQVAAGCGTLVARPLEWWGPLCQKEVRVVLPCWPNGAFQKHGQVMQAGPHGDLLSCGLCWRSAMDLVQHIWWVLNSLHFLKRGKKLDSFSRWIMMSLTFLFFLFFGNKDQCTEGGTSTTQNQYQLLCCKRLGHTYTLQQWPNRIPFVQGVLSSFIAFVAVVVVELLQEQLMRLADVNTWKELHLF